MTDRTNATPTATSSGILRPGRLETSTSLVRTPCSDAVSPWVENHWTLTWDLPAGERFTSSTLPHPACTLSVELGPPRAGVGDDRVVATGVVTRRFDVTIAGSGWVHGVKFRPGGLAALTGLDAAALADRTEPAREMVAAPVVEALRGLDAGTAPEAAARVADDALAGVLPDGPDPSYDLVLLLVSDMLADRSLLSVAQVEERHGVGRRRLERLFSSYVGVSPKWVLARYRMHDVVTALDQGYDGSIADLAASFGWYDQAHFTRDFTRLVGVPPGRYRAT